MNYIIMYLVRSNLFVVQKPFMDPRDDPLQKFPMLLEGDCLLIIGFSSFNFYSSGRSARV